MKSLFINTSSFFMLIAILENDKVLYKKEEKVVADMATKIVPYIQQSFDNVTFDINNIDKLFVVNGPGSFTGVRIGVTAAKTIAWALKKDLIPISSLEVLATTPVETLYKIPAIDARRECVFSGVYDADLNRVMEDKYLSLSELAPYLDNGTIISYDEIDGAVKPQIDLGMIVTKHRQDKPINPHQLNPNYLKKTEAEEKRSVGA